MKPYNKCMRHDRRSVNTGKCLECQRLRGIRLRDRTRKNRYTSRLQKSGQRRVAVTVINAWFSAPLPGSARP